ncbi:MAG: ABC transporter ATP-binding protein [Desulfobulbaceae bacterium]|nr:ABC transporter ATP-binding protein [Desulfobulbaceae bacterium]
MLSKLDLNTAIKVSGVGKCYQRYRNPVDRLKQAIFRQRKYYEDVWVLRDINFELERGKALGIIGRNGAGKSTLLQILCGTLAPTTGEVLLRGKMAALLELGSGFNPEFSGRDNIYVNGAVLGLTRRQIDERFDDIVAFSELGDYIEHPVKTYSSGMQIRLAFSVQVCVNPDILIVDEALAVGDVFFQQKCHAHMEKLLENGTSILLVSHDTSSIRKYCDSALFLENGHNVFYGDVELAVSKFLFKKGNGTQRIGSSLGEEKKIEATFNKSSPRAIEGDYVGRRAPGNGNIPSGSILDCWPESSEFTDIAGLQVIGDENSARFTAVALCGEDGLRKNHFEQGEWAYFFWEVELLRDFEVPVGGITIFSASNIPIFSRGFTSKNRKQFGSASSGNFVKFCASVKTNIAVGDYVVKLAFSEMDFEKGGDGRAHHLNTAVYLDSMRSCVQMPKVLSLVVGESEDDNMTPFFGIVDLPNVLEVVF